MEKENEVNVDLDRERLEIEKQKLELEKQKFAFEKEKHSSQNIFSVKGSDGANIPGVILGVISIITVFLPWVKGVASGSVSVFGQSYSSNISSESISGSISTEGQLSILLLIAGAVFNFKGKKISALLGLIASVLIIVFYFRMQSSGASVTGTGYSSEFRIRMQSGWIVSLIFAIVYTIVSWVKVPGTSIPRHVLSIFALYAVVGVILYLMWWQDTTWMMTWIDNLVIVLPLFLSGILSYLLKKHKYKTAFKASLIIMALVLLCFYPLLLYVLMPLTGSNSFTLYEGALILVFIAFIFAFAHDREILSKQAVKS